MWTSYIFQKDVEHEGTFYKDVENSALLFAFYKDNSIYYVSTVNAPYHLA